LVRHPNVISQAVKLAVAMCLVLAFARPVFAQDFDASEVRLNRSGGTDGSIGLRPGGRLEVRNSTFREMLLVASFPLPKRLMDLLGPDLIVGGPSWIDTDRFDVVAKADANTSSRAVRSMLQAILKERFHLESHREDKVMRAYSLRSAGRLKLEKSSSQAEPGCVPLTGGDVQIHRDCRNMSMAALAEALPGLASYFIDLPVVDRTDLTGSYDFRLDWAPIRRAEGGIGSPPVLGDAAGATIFDSLGYLGLRLQEGRYPVTVIAIDRVDRLAAGK
jgi:uncharacterized protein (TIGR03435 family)